MTFNLFSSNDLSKVSYIDSPFSRIIADKTSIKLLLKSLSENHGVTKITPSARLMGIEPRAMRNFINQLPVEISTFDRIIKFCNVNNTDTRNSIYSIDNITNPNIPLNFESLSGVRLDAGIFNEGRMRNRSIEYHNKDDEIISIILKCAKKVVSKKFNPAMSIDRRNDTKCIYFPPYFAKHYTKLKTTESNKNKLDLRIPSYILNSENFQKIWWRANLSEEATLCYHITTNKRNSSLFINPLIQLNRVKEVNIEISQKNEERLYHKNIPSSILSKLNKSNHSLLMDEAKILTNFNINYISSFSSLYKNKIGIQTAVYSLLINKVNDLELFNSEIGFELQRQKRQLSLLLDNPGRKSREKIRDIIIKFYKLVPQGLRGSKKIKNSKWLEKEDVAMLLGKENDKATDRGLPWACGSWKNEYN